MDDRALEGGLQFVRQVYLCRELAGGVERFCTLPTKNIIEKELANRALLEGKKAECPYVAFCYRKSTFVTTRHCHTPLLPPGPLPNCNNPFAVSKRVTDNIAHVTALVLKVCSLCKCKWSFYLHLVNRCFKIETMQELEVPDHKFLESPAPIGIEVLCNLKHYIFGDDKNLSLSHLACHGTYSQACLAAQLCVAVLIEAVSSSNCFSLLLAAENSNCLKLKEIATRCISSKFTEAVTSNFESFALLNEAQLLSILTSNQLVLDSEIEVFNALSWWTEAALPERFHRFGHLMATCLRFEELSLEELTQILDESELVASDNFATQLGARAVIQRHMGVPLDIIPGTSRCLQPRIGRNKYTEDGKSCCADNSQAADTEHAANSNIGMPFCCHAILLCH